MNQPTPIQKTTSLSRLVRNGFLAVLPAIASAALAQTDSAPAAAAPAPTDNDVVTLSPFTVSTEKDVGYRASNSIAGTRTNTAIKDIPVNIQVFTKDLADDLIIKNQVDFEAYNGSLVYGGADRFSDNPIQQPYQDFLVRGFRQNWGLRDGVREYDPIDMQAFSRVEVVKGPVAALYGLAYPGGVMNNITKTVDFSKNFGNIRFTLGNEGDYRATLDVNATGTAFGQKIGIRVNGADEKTKDVRAHSEGKVTFENVLLAWEPFPTTSIEFMTEHGYREKPNGLQYFSTGTPASEAGSHADVPLQIARANIPWDWNWSNGKDMRSLETNVYRAKINQRIGDNLNVTGYIQYSSRLNIDGNGWDANGSGGADSWESQGSGLDLANNRIISTYHYRDWGNKMHAYGVTGVYKLDTNIVKSTFAFGTNVWGEKEQSRASGPYNPNDTSSTGYVNAALQTAIYVPITANIDTTNVPANPPPNLAPESLGGPNGNGYHSENNSNDYYFFNWQGSWWNDRIKTNVGINRTNIKLIAWNNGASPTPDNVYTASKWSPLFGAVFDITHDVSFFITHGTSLFPDSTKDSFGHQFSPQSGSSWEGGFKVDVLEGKISGTVSYFDITQTGGTQSAPYHDNLNTQIWDSLTAAQRAIQFPGKTRDDLFAAGDIIAGGKQESKGVDLDLIFQATRQLQIVTSFEHVNHHFVTSTDPSVPVGTTYQYAQKDHWGVIGKYTFTDGDLKNLFLGMGVSGGSKSLQDYIQWNGSLVARYEPGRTVGELFAGYRMKVGKQALLFQANVKNLFKTPDYVGWKSTGSSTILATQRYSIPTPMVFRFTVGLDF
jgi:outer membrane receptor protein involved in Fe transport